MLLPLLTPAPGPARRESDAIRPVADVPRLAAPAQPDGALRHQSVDRAMHDRHRRAPIRRGQRPRHFARTDRRTRGTPAEQRQRRGARIRLGRLTHGPSSRFGAWHGAGRICYAAAMRARNPLYVMAKPPSAVAARIAALPRTDPKRGPELLHVTLLTLFDRAVAPPAWLPALVAALDGFAGASFPLAFDRIEEHKAVTLRTRAPLAEARAFQAALIRHLLLARAPIGLGTTPVPHLTIAYRGDGKGSEKLDPMGWTVDEILLVESVVGKTTHVTHGRWPLR